MAHKVLHDLGKRSDPGTDLQAQITELQISLEERAELLAAKGQQISLLEAEIVRLRALGKPIARQQPESVRALPILTPDPKTGKAACTVHGSVSPNVRRQCPQCFCEAVRAASPTCKGVVAEVAAVAEAAAAQ